MNSESIHKKADFHASTPADKIPDRFHKNAGIAARNRDRVGRRNDNLGNEEVSDDERILNSEDEIEYQQDIGGEDDKFSALQNLSKADFRKVINFSLKSAAEAAVAATQNVTSNQLTPISTSKVVTPFNRHAIVFKVADEIPCQEIPDCIWKLVQAKVPLTLSCITTASIRYIHNNPTSIKTTCSADGVSQSKELMLDMSTFGAPEDITLADWQDAWINRLEIIKKTSEKDIYKYFKAHKQYVLQQEDFAEEFEAYKQFNIYFCRHYSNTRFKMNPQKYSAKILKFKLKFPRASFVMKPLSIPPVPRSGSQHQSVRYEPYDRNKGAGIGYSFPKGTNSGAQMGQCLICGRSGHRGSNCSYSTTEKGARVTTCWKNGHVITTSSNAEPCFQWNLRSECKSNHRASDHFCSMCGSKDHTLSS